MKWTRQFYGEKEEPDDDEDYIFGFDCESYEETIDVINRLTSVGDFEGAEFVWSENDYERFERDEKDDFLLQLELEKENVAPNVVVTLRFEGCFSEVLVQMENGSARGYLSGEKIEADCVDRFLKAIENRK